MAEIPFTGDAGDDVLARIQSGTLEIAGLLVREAKGNRRYTHLIRGVESAETTGGLPDTSPLAPLQAAIGTQKLLGLVSIAQNAATAATLRRIEAKLDAMAARLSGMDKRLGNLQLNMTLVLATLKSSPVARLRAAATSGSIAHRLGERSALIMAAGQADRAARDLLDMAGHLVTIGQDTVPAALLAPADLAGLVQGASDAAKVASALYMALSQDGDAARFMHETATAIEKMRNGLGMALVDRNVSIRRVSIGTVPDEAIRAMSATLRECQHAALGRALLIELGVIVSGRPDDGFEIVRETASPGFMEVVPAASNSPRSETRPSRH